MYMKTLMMCFVGGMVFGLTFYGIIVRRFFRPERF